MANRAELSGERIDPSDIAGRDTELGHITPSGLAVSAGTVQVSSAGQFALTANQTRNDMIISRQVFV